MSPVFGWKVNGSNRRSNATPNDHGLRRAGSWAWPMATLVSITVSHLNWLVPSSIVRTLFGNDFMNSVYWLHCCVSDRPLFEAEEERHQVHSINHNPEKHEKPNYMYGVYTLLLAKSRLKTTDTSNRNQLNTERHDFLPKGSLFWFDALLKLLVGIRPEIANNIGYPSKNRPNRFQSISRRAGTPYWQIEIIRWIDRCTMLMISIW